MKLIKKILVMLVVVIALGAVVASGEENKAEKVGSSDTSKKSESAANNTYSIGDEVKIGSFTVKIYGVQDPVPPTSDFIKPEDGKRWVGVDTEVKNISSKSQTVSSILCYELKDSENHTYSVALFDVEPKAPEGDLAPDELKRGIVVFEVPQNASGFEFRFSCDIGDSGSAIIKL